MEYTVLDIGPNCTTIKIQTDGQPAMWCKVEPTNATIKEVAKTLKVGSKIVCAFMKKNGYASFTNLTLAENYQKQITQPINNEENIMPIPIPNVGKANNFASTSQYKCEDCGATLKDDKYKTCYTCSMARKAAKPLSSTLSTTKTWGKSPEEQASIKAQAIGHMVSRTLIGLGAQVDIANIEEVMERLYKKYQELVG